MDESKRVSFFKPSILRLCLQMAGGSSKLCLFQPRWSTSASSAFNSCFPLQAVPTSKGQELADEYGIKFFETVCLVEFP